METCPSGPPEEIFGLFAFGFMCFFVCIGLFLTILMVIAYCKIAQKAGYSWALGLLMLVPIANVIMPLFLAFSDWPIHQQLRLQQQSQ